MCNMVVYFVLRVYCCVCALVYREEQLLPTTVSKNQSDESMHNKVVKASTVSI